jgi:hypothetical protein
MVMLDVWGVTTGARSVVTTKRHRHARHTETQGPEEWDVALAAWERQREQVPSIGFAADCGQRDEGTPGQW